MMTSTPIIVISSIKPRAGKTTLALNLAAALWADKYQVKFLAPNNSDVENFIRRRERFCQENKILLPFPKLINNLHPEAIDSDEKAVVIADIPTAKNQEYAFVFAKAHTLITVADSPVHLQTMHTDAYNNLVWQAKKNIAARGIKYLNWIIVPNLWQENMWPMEEINEQSRRYGFRIAPGMHEREAFRHVKDGYCAADMVSDTKVFKMSMADVYARREILQLTDFLWHNK